MKWLTIDCTKPLPAFGAVEDGKRFGTLRLLDWRELPEFAKWVGVAGGRDLLDAFEVALINDGMLWIWPIDADGEPLHDECECVGLEHHDNGIRLIWEPKIPCEACGGEGHFAAIGDEVCEEDLCAKCDSDGWNWGREIVTDMDGLALPDRVLS